jgi:flavin-binding protein dodecin
MLFILPKKTYLVPDTIFHHPKTTSPMSIVKVIEVIASSEIGIDDAVRKAVSEASKSIRNIDSVYVQDIKAHVKDGKITTFGVICKISFRVDSVD